MPRAQAYLVQTGGVWRLEDRFARSDLWLSRAIDGDWRDDEGREFLIASLDVAVPALADGETLTRADYVAGTRPIGKKDFRDLFAAVDMLSPVAPSEEFTRPRQMPRGYKDVRYYQGTNTSAIVCAYLPEKADSWSLAAWTLAEGDDFAERTKAFEDGFLAGARDLACSRRGPDAGAKADE
ncbi:MAG: hypothetical protein IJ783_02625, partial [Kiritimatiellae bacterium]|nr:hypothetical protein [Kiritimatiellia bacterium]